MSFWAPPSQTCVKVFSGGVRLEKDGDGELVLILPQGPFLLGHPLCSFKPYSDLMSCVQIFPDRVEIQMTWTAVHTWHQNASEISQVLTCDWISLYTCFFLHLTRENTHHTLSCLAALNQPRLGHLRLQFWVQSQLYSELSSCWPRCILMLSVNRASILSPASLKWNTD